LIISGLIKSLIKEEIVLFQDKIQNILEVGDDVSSLGINKILLADDTIGVTITNTGSYNGSVSVLAFMVPPDAGQNGNPLKFLFAFQKVYLEVGANTTISFAVSAFDLSVVVPNGQRQSLPGIWKIQIGDLELPILVV